MVDSRMIPSLRRLSRAARLNAALGAMALPLVLGPVRARAQERAQDRTQAQPQRATAELMDAFVDQLPTVTVRQVPTGTRSWGGSARVMVDRDAFLTVIEVGADGRARVVFPATPRDRGFVRGGRAVYAPLPSADAMFVRTAAVRVPLVVAFASDVAPILTEFGTGRMRWDYQYAVPASGEPADVVAQLAELLYGSNASTSPVFGVAATRIAPVLNLASQRLLSSCGYQLGAMATGDFYQFLWDLYGPYALGNGWSAAYGMSLYDIGMWGLGGWYVPFPWYAFTRSTDYRLWQTFGSVCDPLRRQPFLLAFTNMPGRPGFPRDPSFPNDTLLTQRPMPGDRELVRPPVIGDLGVDTTVRIGDTPAPPAGTVTEVLVADAPATREGATREAMDELVQRQEIERFMADLQMRRSLGIGGLNDVRGGSWGGGGRAGDVRIGIAPASRSPGTAPSYGGARGSGGGNPDAPRGASGGMSSGSAGGGRSDVGGSSSGGSSSGGGRSETTSRGSASGGTGRRPDGA